MKIGPPIVCSDAAHLAHLSARGLSDCLIDLINSSGMLSNNLLLLIVGKLIDGPATGAGEGKSVQFHPSDWHLELCAAIASDRNPYSINISHNWPLLVTHDLADVGTESSQSK